LIPEATREKGEMPLHFTFRSLHDYCSKKAAHDFAGQREVSGGSASEGNNQM
jgi:hypothetical protein